MDRELGAKPFECPNCGAQLDDVVNPDGSVTHKPCAHCYGPQETPSQPPVPQQPTPTSAPGGTPGPEVASLQRETGSQVPPAAPAAPSAGGAQ
jgi:hypothetical protein